MYNRDFSNSHLAKNSQNALQNHLKEQEDRKKALQRESHTRELRELESKLYHKQKELFRIKTQLDRLKKEAVVRESNFKQNLTDIQKQKSLKDLESKANATEQSTERNLIEINKQIEQKKQELARLERQKSEIVTQGESQKKSIASTLITMRSKLNEYDQKKAGEKRLFDITQKQIVGLEQSLKQFSQEISILENKIKALKVMLR